MDHFWSRGLFGEKSNLCCFFFLLLILSLLIRELEFIEFGLHIFSEPLDAISDPYVRILLTAPRPSGVPFCVLTMGNSSIL